VIRVVTETVYSSSCVQSGSNISWTNPNYAAASDNNRASAVGYNDGTWASTTTNTLVATLNKPNLYNTFDIDFLEIIVEGYETIGSGGDANIFSKVKVNGTLCSNWHKVEFDSGDDRYYSRCYHHEPLYVQTATVQIEEVHAYAEFTGSPAGLLHYIYVDALGIRVNYTEVTDNSFAVTDYTIKEVTPNKAIIRAYLEDGKEQYGNYEHTNEEDGFKYMVDLILEAGKHGATIIPYMDKSTYGIGLNISEYHDVSDNLGVAGLEEVQVPEVFSALSKTFDIPLALSMRDNSSHITGFHGIKKGNVTINSDQSLDEFIGTIRLRDITDPKNVQNVFGVFSKNYDDFHFVQGEDFDTISATVADTTASNGNYGKVNNNSTGIWSVGTMERGSYIALVRMKRSAYGRSTFLVEEGGTTRESYGYNIGNGANTFYLQTAYNTYALPFTVNVTSAINIDIGTSSLDAGDTHVDFAMVIPLSNGRDYTFDLLLQNLAIYDQEYVGLIK